MADRFWEYVETQIQLHKQILDEIKIIRRLIEGNFERVLESKGEKVIKPIELKQDETKRETWMEIVDYYKREGVKVFSQTDLDPSFSSHKERYLEYLKKNGYMYHRKKSGDTKASFIVSEEYIKDEKLIKALESIFSYLRGSGYSDPEFLKKVVDWKSLADFPLRIIPNAFRILAKLDKDTVYKAVDMVTYYLKKRKR